MAEVALGVEGEEGPEPESERWWVALVGEGDVKVEPAHISRDAEPCKPDCEAGTDEPGG